MIVRFSEDPSSPLYQFQVFQDSRLLQQETRSFTTALTLGLLIVAILFTYFCRRTNVLGASSAVYGYQRFTSGGEGRVCETISESYPKEISALTSALNTVIEAERKQRERYRNSVGDLAHSLKTPLAVIQGEIQQIHCSDPELANSVQQQVSRMNEVITYQLKRASSAGKRFWTKPVALKACLSRVLDVLNKVYQNKRISCDIRIEDNLGFVGDESDFMEIAGNLI